MSIMSFENIVTEINIGEVTIDLPFNFKYVQFDTPFSGIPKVIVHSNSNIIIEKLTCDGFTAFFDNNCQNKFQYTACFNKQKISRFFNKKVRIQSFFGTCVVSDKHSTIYSQLQTAFNPHSQWEILAISDSNGEVYIQNVLSKKYLASRKDELSAISQSTKAKECVWKLTKSNKGKYSLLNVESGFYLSSNKSEAQLYSKLVLDWEEFDIILS